MYHPTTRALAVLSLLQAHGRMTGSEIAQRLEVNQRTVRDYITMLQDLGAPIVAERGRNGAYVLDSDFKLPPLMFTNDEAVAIAIGLLAARQFGLSEIVPAAENARIKLEQGMSDDLKQRMRALLETVTLGMDSVPLASSSEIVLTMSGAAQMQRRVHLHYRSSLEQETERNFDPYGLAYYRGKWYTAGYCHLRHDMRSFRLDRVMQVELTEMSFERPQRFNALAYVVQALATLPHPYNFEILLKTDLITARHEIMEVLGLLEPHAEGVLLRGSTDDLEWLARELANLSFDFIVRQPEPLREALRQRAAKLIALAEMS